MDIINPPTDHLEKELVQIIGQQKIKPTVDSYYAPLENDLPSSNWKNILDFGSFERKIEEAFKIYVLCLKSNGGFNKKTKINKASRFPLGKFSIQLIAPFKLFLRENTEQLNLFARGHRLKVKANSRLPELIDLLHQGRILSLDTLQSVLLSEWDMVTIYSFIAELLSVKAIKIID